jgi:putative GTP pyrophosphokinase
MTLQLTRSSRVALDRDDARTAYDERALRYGRANEQIKVILNDLLDDLGERYGVRDGFYVMGQPKTFERFYRKATEKYECKSLDEAFSRVRDLARVRVVCPTLDDCYSLLELLQGQEAIYVDETKIEDFISGPSPTGYRAIHLEVTIDATVGGKRIGVPVEIQIRSTLQEAWGHYTHADFYHEEDAPKLVGKLMKDLSDLLYWADQHAAILVNEITEARDTSKRRRR